MGLQIQTFSNVTGSETFFKAIGHPLAMEPMKALLETMKARGPVAIYDPMDFGTMTGELHDFSDLDIVNYFVQDLDHLEKNQFGLAADPIIRLPETKAKSLLVIAYEHEKHKLVAHIKHLIPEGMAVHTLDEIRIPDEHLTLPREYLSKFNFATNFAFFRDTEGHHTRVVSSNYFGQRNGGKPVKIWCRLFGMDGQSIKDWWEDLPEAGSSITLDSREIRARFGLDAFIGQLFMHVHGAAGHDIVKYALDTYGDSDEVLSCTHDANAFPADLYAGLPAPRGDEDVVLWVQNSHSRPIPSGEVGLNMMGRNEIRWLDREIPPFGSYALSTKELWPEGEYPGQLEIQAGKYFVRPRYEIRRENGRMRIAHPNVQRTDLQVNQKIKTLNDLMGKSFILPAPILPKKDFSSAFLPTPMSTAAHSLPIAALAYDKDGRQLFRQFLGDIPRHHSNWYEIDEMLQHFGEDVEDFGHMELVYDFQDGGEADGWLHSIFHFTHRDTGHAAETSFGAHIFNTVLTVDKEPQAYMGRAPGLSTRLFLRIGEPDFDTQCHLIYPASTPWHEYSDTKLMLHDRAGKPIVEKTLNIPCSGSRYWRMSSMFDTDERAAAAGGYVIIRDMTCRLFGYHGLIRADEAGKTSAFSLDHMFGM